VSQRAVLGVDAGGSATRAVLVRGGDVVARYELPPLNVLLQVDAVERLVALITDSGADAAGLGLAGLRGVEHAQHVQKELRYATGVDVVVADDTAIALLGAFDGGPGIVVVAGTGSNAFGRATDGTTARVGGYGFLLGDEGGAYWIANQAIRAALRSRDGTGPKAPGLERAVPCIYGLDFDELTRAIYRDVADRTPIAGAAERLANVDDPVMVAILDAGTDALVAMAHALRAQLDAGDAGPPLPVAVHGGVFRNVGIRSRFIRAIEVVEPVKAPEFGAVDLVARREDR
jgi:glucosamine kinase